MSDPLNDSYTLASRLTTGRLIGKRHRSTIGLKTGVVLNEGPLEAETV